MKKRIIALLTVLVFVVAVAGNMALGEAAGKDYTLEQVVVLSRHNLRRCPATAPCPRS